MPLIEILTPGGNMYPDGNSEFAMLVQFFRRLAENRDTQDRRILADAQANTEEQLKDTVRGAVSGMSTDPARDPAGGYIGENGRPTELVVEEDGTVPGYVLDAWMDRGGAAAYQSGLNPDAPAGGFLGENNRPTELVVNEDGTVPAEVLAAWGARMGAITAPEPGPSSAYGVAATRDLRVRDRSGRVVRQTSRVDQLAAWGDSLTDGWTKPPFAADQSDAWPGVLAQRIGRPVYNGGKSGQSADEIALRQGGLVLEVTPAGGQLPASGAVTVTTAQVIGWRLDRGWSCTGTIAGVHGTLSRSADVLTFTRTTAGTAVPVAGPAPFTSEPGQLYADCTSILMLGRNDVGYTGVPAAGPQIDRIVGANVAAVQSLTPAHPRFLIMGTINATSEAAGSGGHTTVTTANRVLSELYPDNYLDIRDYIVRQSLYDQGLTPTSTDLQHIDTDRPPPQIMLDGVHYTPATAATIAARVHLWLTDKGWI